MKHTKQLFMILLVVFLLVGLGTLAASDVTKNDTSVIKNTDVTKTNTVSKDSASKVSTTTKDNDNTKIVDTKPNSKTDETIKNKTIKKTNYTKDVKTATRTVNVNTYAQFKDAIRNSSFDTVIINLNNNIVLSPSPNNEWDLYVYDTIKTLTINGNGHTIDGQGKYLFGVHNFTDVTINNVKFKNTLRNAIRTKGSLTVRNSEFTNNVNTTLEGTIWVDGTLNPTTTYVTLENNRFINVPGLSLYNCTAKISKNYFYNCTGKDGGALHWGSMTNYNNGYTIEITDNTFEKNRALHCGGAIRTDGNTKILNNKFEENSAGRGGSIAHYSGSLTLNNNTITKSIVHHKPDNDWAEGGAIYISSEYYKSSGTITNNTIKNTSFMDHSHGGVLFLEDVSFTIEKNNIVENDIRHENSLGLLYISNSTITMRYNNITNNKGLNGIILNWADSDLTLSYNNISKNYAATYGVIYNSGTMRITNNNITDNWAGNWVINTKGTTQFINNFCKNNTDNKRDMLLNELPSRIYGNTYIDNYLELEKENPFTNIGTKTTYNNNATVVTVNLNLRSAYNDTIRNGTIKAYVNGSQVTSASVTNGIASISIPYNRLPNSSNTTVNLTYQSLSKHYQNAKTSFTVNRRWNTKIEIQPPTGTITYNETKPVKFTLKDINNNVLSSKSLTITIDGKSYTSTTNVNGIVTINHKFTNVGSRTISVRFASSTPYLSSSNSTTVTVNKINTELTLDVINSMHPEDTTTITATLKDEYGNPVIGEIITLKENERTLISTTTNSEGKVSIAYTPLTHGIKIITAEYDAETSTVYETQSEAQKEVRVTKIPTHFHIDYDDIHVGQQFDIILQLDDVDHTYLQGKPINVLIREPGETPTTVSTTTGINGIARIPYTPKTLNISVEATFAGDNRYDLTEFKETIPGNITYISVTATDTIINQTNSIKIKVVNKSMQPVTGQVYILIDEQSYGLKNLNSNGEFELTSYYSSIYRDEVPVKVEYISDTHNDNIGETTFMVSKIPTKTRATIVSQTVVNNTIRVDVTADNGVIVNTGEVILYHRNTVVGLGNVRNGYAIIQTSLTTPGIYNLVSSYETNEYYLYSSNNTRNFELQKIPTQTRARILNNTAGNVTLDITVTSSDATVTDGIVEVYVNDNNTPVGRARIENGHVIIPTTLTKGFYNFDIKYNGTADKFLPSNDATSLINTEVVGKPSQIRGIPDNNTYGNSRINITLIDPETQTPIANAPINITDSIGKTVGTGTTDRDGKATIPVTVPVGYNPLTATYPGNPTYEGSSTKVDLTVEKIPTKTNVDILNNTLTNVTIKVKVTNNTGDKVTTGTITILNNNGQAISGLTNIILNKGESTIKLPITTAGETTIKVKYNENELYNESYAKNQTTGQPEIKITVEKIPTKTTVGILDNTLTNVTIKVKVTNMTNVPVTTGTITILNNNGQTISGLTNIRLNNGESTIKIPSQYAGEKIIITVHYNENEIYNESYAQNETNGKNIPITVTKIPTTTTITVNGNTVKNINATGRVTDKFNKPVTEGTVIIKNGDTELGKATITNGQYNIPLNINTQGRYNLVAQYLGTNNYLPSNTNLIGISINPRPSQITGKPEGSIAGTTNVTATLKDPETGKPITNAPITVTLPNGNKITGTTDNNGNVKVPVDLPKGNNKVKIDYPGNSTYKPSTTTVDVPVTGKTPTIQVTPVGNKVGKTHVTTTLKDPITGKPIPNAPITITLPDGTKIPATTDNNGNVKVPVDLREGLNTVTVTYQGNGTYNPISNKTTFNISKNPVKINLNPIKGVIGEKITLTAYITDEDGNTISGGNLAFKLNGKTLRSDGRFDSSAPAMKFSVKDGKITYTINADLYLRNAKNLTAAYSGNYKFEETGSETVEAQIQKRYAGVTLTVTPTQNKQYDTIKFTATVRDTTKNGKNQTLINQNTKVMFKVNGNTLRDKNKQIIYVPVNTNKQATYNYQIPASTGGITANKLVRDYKVEAIFVGDNYYPGARNNSIFNVERSPTTVTITQAKVTTGNILSVKATLKDFKGNNLIGTNKVTVKINGKSYIDPKNGKPKYWSVKNGVVDLTGITVDPKTTIKRVMVVTGERQAYLEGRTETTNIVKA